MALLITSGPAFERLREAARVYFEACRELAATTTTDLADRDRSAVAAAVEALAMVYPDQATVPFFSGLGAGSAVVLAQVLEQHPDTFMLATSAFSEQHCLTFEEMREAMRPKGNA